MDQYYKNMVLFAMQDAVYKILDKYLEYIQDSEHIDPAIDIEMTSKVIGEFKVWLFKVAR